MKINQLKLGAVLSYLQMGLSIVIGIVFTPIMIRLLGKSEYGLYNTVASTIAMMSILSLGLNSGYIRFYSKYKNSNEEEKIYRLNGFFLMIYMLISTVVLACGFYLTNNLRLVFDDGLTSAEYGIAKVLMVLMTVNLAMSFPMSLFTSIISAHEKFVFLKLVGIMKTVVSPLTTLVFLMIGFRSIAMATVTVSVSLIADILYISYVFGHLKQKIRFAVPEKGLFRDIFSYTAFIAINLIVDQINWNVGKVVVARFNGTGAVAVYTVGYSLYQYYQMFSTSISGVFTPKIHRVVNATKENVVLQRKELSALFIRVGRIQFIILGLIATGVLFFGKQFIIHFWAGAGYGDSYYVALLLIFSASIALIQNVGIEVQRALNKHRFRSLVYLVMAVVNICIMIVLVQKIGAVGAACGTALALLLANGLIMNIYYHKRCNIDIISFFKSIGRLSIGLIIPMCVGVLINLVLTIDNLLLFVICVIAYSFVYIVSMYFLGFNQYEKELLRKITNGLKRKPVVATKGDGKNVE